MASEEAMFPVSGDDLAPGRGDGIPVSRADPLVSSSEEYFPQPQSAEQKEVEARVL
jgi:hypothetical protein